MNIIESNAIGLTRINPYPVPTKQIMRYRRVWQQAFQYNTQTPMPYLGQIFIPVNNFGQLVYYNRPGINTSTSQANPTNKYTKVLQILAGAFATRSPNGNNGIY